MVNCVCNVLLHISFQGGVTALHITCYKGMTDIIKYIAPPRKEEGQRPGVKADINIQDDVRTVVF